MNPQAPEVRARLSRAFRSLRKKHKAFARANWTCCCGCGMAAVPADKRDGLVVFYHGQDAQHFEETGTTYLAWSGNAALILAALHVEGLTTAWDGTDSQRILVTGFVADPGEGVRVVGESAPERALRTILESARPVDASTEASAESVEKKLARYEQALGEIARLRQGPNLKHVIARNLRIAVSIAKETLEKK